MARRAPAVVSLLLAATAVALAVAVAISRFPRGLSVLACVALAFVAAWYAVRRQGLRRRAGAAVAALALAGAVALVIVEGHLVADLVVLAAAVGSIAAAARAFTAHVRLPTADPPAHPVLVYNPLSGDGKAERFRLAEEARRRGIEPVELKPGDDLEQLVREAVATRRRRAGDGGRRRVAGDRRGDRRRAGLPYACIPAGTRNHFALDLGVDRDDVVGALDAFVDGGERRVDLAEVNGRVFVNNVSLGLYAEAVQKQGYREAKLAPCSTPSPR